MTDGAESRLFHRNLSTTLPRVSHGRGVWLYDGDGTAYLDACGGAAVSCLGHGDKRISRAIARQLEHLEYAHTSFFTNDAAEALAQHLIDRAPPAFSAGRAMFLGSGSEAMEAALKLARQCAVERGELRRSVIIGRDMAYHGNTLGALATGGHAQRREHYVPLLIDVERVSACHPYRHRREGESTDQYTQRLVEELEAKILQVGADRVLAFVVETVAGATLGSVPPTSGYFCGVRDVCDRYGVLLIADEVMCGSGRTGTFYAFEQEDISPDIITIAKGVGAGYQPIAATLASGAIVASIAAGSGALANGHTYMGHAVACAGAAAAVEAIDDKMLAGVRDQGDRLRVMLEDRLGDDPNVGDIRGRGLFQTLELVHDKDAKQPFPASCKIAQRLKANAFARGLLVYPSQGCVDGARGDHVILAPPYTIGETELELLVDRLATAIEATLSAP